MSTLSSDTLGVIASFASFDSLSSFRLVSHDWNNCLNHFEFTVVTLENDKETLYDRVRYEFWMGKYRNFLENYLEKIKYLTGLHSGIDVRLAKFIGFEERRITKQIRHLCHKLARNDEKNCFSLKELVGFHFQRASNVFRSIFLSHADVAQIRVCAVSDDHHLKPFLDYLKAYQLIDLKTLFCRVKSLDIDFQLAKNYIEYEMSTGRYIPKFKEDFGMCMNLLSIPQIVEIISMIDFQFFPLTRENINTLFKKAIITGDVNMVDFVIDLLSNKYNIKEPINDQIRFNYLLSSFRDFNFSFSSLWSQHRVLVYMPKVWCVISNGTVFLSFKT